MRKLAARWRRTWPYFLTAALTLVGLYYVVGPYLLAPNGGIYGYGGDAYVLYYDLVYHVLHGSPGHYFDAMLHPLGELIYMTDAQGMLAVTLQWVHRYVIDLSDRLVGIVHSLNNLSVVAASPLVYVCLRRLGVGLALTCVLTPGIVLLSPQVPRIGGHFGLAYVFVIPLTVWWFLRERRGRRGRLSAPEVYDAVAVASLLFLTFNNPYTGFSAGLTLLLACALAYWRVPARRPDLATTALLMAGVLGAVYAYLKIADIHDDRLVLQWGPLVFRTHWTGSLVPPGSLLRRWLAADATSLWEARQYLGVVPVLALSCWGLLSAGARLRGLRLGGGSPAVPRAWWSYCAAAALVYLFVYDWGLSAEAARWIEERAGFLLMFKAIARIAWPFYYAVAFSGALALQRLLDAVPSERPWAPWLILATAAYLTVDDVRVYHRDRNPQYHDNVFRASELARIREVAAGLGIDPRDYQALLGVPRVLTWHDNVMVEWDWKAHFVESQLSLATGLPMVNANLGRAPTGPLVNVTQLMSEPLIARGTLLDQLDADGRDLLLIAAEESHPLSAGERYLLSVADSLGPIDGAFAYRLSLERLRSAQATYEAAAVAAADTLARGPLHYDGFGEGGSPEGYLAAGALRLPYGTHSLAEVRIPAAVASDVAVKCWFRATHERFGMGYLDIESRDADGGPVATHRVEVRRSRNAHDGWMQASASVEARAGGTISVSVTSPREEIVDDLLIYAPERPVLVPGEGARALLDGVRVGG